MTEKRFTLIKNSGTDECILDNLYDNCTYIGAISSSGSEMICYLLNHLHEENQSKEKVLHLAANKIETLLEENEKLKKENKSLIKGIKDSAKQGADTITAVWTSQNQFKRMNEGYYD